MIKKIIRFLFFPIYMLVVIVSFLFELLLTTVMYIGTDASFKRVVDFDVTNKNFKIFINVLLFKKF